MKPTFDKYISGDLLPEERRELLERLENEEDLRDEFAAYLNLHSLTSLELRPGDIPEGERSFAARAGQHGTTERSRLSTRRRSSLRVAIAAAVAILLVTGAWHWSGIRTQNAIYDGLGAYNSAWVPAGQRVSLTLSDGTQVWLNSQSTLEYPSLFGSQERKVRVTGEAFFDVMPDIDRPFSVETESLTVTVTGTSFNVSDYPDTAFAEVGLVEGAVKVEISDMEGVWEMEAGRYLNYSAGEVATGNIDENYYLWRSGVYYFDRAPLGEIASKLETYYDVVIDIRDSALRDRLYTGKFRQQDGVAEILRIIGMTHPFRVERQDLSNVYIIKPI